MDWQAGFCAYSAFPPGGMAGRAEWGRRDEYWGRRRAGAGWQG